MGKPDYNIEISHIYADEEFGPEQVKSIGRLKEAIGNLSAENKLFVVSVLIDDFHPEEIKLNEIEFIHALEKYGISPDFICYESRLVGISNKLIQEFPKKMLKLEYFDKSKREVLMFGGRIGLKEKSGFYERHTCALLSASWALCRLGLYKIPADAIHNLTNKEFHAKKTITILPEKYRVVENKVLEIIKATRFKNAVKNMEYDFF